MSFRVQFAPRGLVEQDCELTNPIHPFSAGLHLLRDERRDFISWCGEVSWSET